jgi:hypothetical protein
MRKWIFIKYRLANAASFVNFVTFFPLLRKIKHVYLQFFCQISGIPFHNEV